MEKGNGSNHVPGWVKRDLRVLKRVSVSLVDTLRETRRDMAETRRDIAETRQEMIALQRVTQSQFAEMRQQHAVDFSEVRQQTRALKKTSDIHSKAILKLLRKI